MLFKLKMIRFLADITSSFISSLIPVNKKLVLFHGSSISNYNESTRYLYEHMLDNSNLSVVWMTDSNIVYEYLLKLNRPVVFHRSLLGMFHYIRAGCVVGNGTSYPSLLGFTGRNSIKICLHHGMGPRSTNSADESRYKKSNQIVKLYSSFDYFNSTSKFTNIAVARLQFLIPKSKRIIYGMPRCDHLFDHEKNNRLKIKKPFLNSLDLKISKNSKCILYSPTWRPGPNSTSFPLTLLNGFDLSNFDTWLSENDIFIYISVHPHVKDFEDFSGLSNISYLKQSPLTDINQVLPEIDLLITDYSSIATDFMILNRPVIYVMPDYEYYLNEFGLLEDIREKLPGYEAKTMIELKNMIIGSLSKPLQMEKERKNYLRKYYDLDNHSSSENISSFIQNVMNK